MCGYPPSAASPRITTPATSASTHGTIGLTSALRVSCNAFFCLYGNQAGHEEITAVGEMLVLGQKSGAPMSGEHAGVLPGPVEPAKGGFGYVSSVKISGNSSVASAKRKGNADLPHGG